MALGIVAFASVLGLLTAWETASSIGSLETQEGIESFLAQQPFASLGLDQSFGSRALHTLAMIGAAGFAATAILAFYVRNPDRSARWGLTALAGPVFVAGVATDSLAGSFVAAGTAMLWMSPAREWFRTGRWTPPEPVADGGARRTPWDRPPSPPGSRPDSPPRPADARSGSVPPPGAAPRPDGPPPAEHPFGQHRPNGQPLARSPQQRPDAAWGARPPTPQRHQVLLHPRPAAMVAAFVMTVIGAGGLLVLSLMLIALVSLSPDRLMSAMVEQQPDLVEQGLTLEQVRTTVLAFSGVLVVWCVLALVLAGFAMARRDWARRGLMVSAAVSAVACLSFTLTFPPVVLAAAVAVATVLCLRSVDVRRWFALEPR